MITDKIQELNTLKAKLAGLEQQISAEVTKELASLPGKYGFESADEFVAAVRAASGGWKGPGRPAGKAGRRRRAVITDAMRAQVKKLAGKGKTSAAIAKTVGISLPSVQNIKKALGLVKARGK